MKTKPSRRRKHLLRNIPLPPWPVMPLTPKTDLHAEKVAALCLRLRVARATCGLLVDWVMDLRAQLTAQRALADELAAELEQVYALNDQGAVALAVLAQEDVDGEKTHG